MRILYFVYSQQISFESFTENPRTGFPWFDCLLNELHGNKDLKIGLVVPLLNDTLQKETTESITYYGLPVPGKGTSLLRLFRRIIRYTEETDISSSVDEVTKDFNPDLIQIFGTENPFGLLVFKTSKPVVIHFQGSVNVVLVKWYAGISKWDLLRFSKKTDIIFMRGCYGEYFGFSKKAEREKKIMEKCSYYIGRTEFDKRLIALLSPQSRYFHCDEFIRDEFFRSKWNLPLGTKVKCVSILKGVTYKGIDLLVETLAIFQNNSSIFIEFLVCGVGENEEVVEIIRRKYRRKVDFSGIRFLGKLTTDSLVKQLSSSNFFVHPSYMENSSNSICEAMALGMPVIATNVGGTSSLIQDGIDGLLVQEGDPFALASALNVLINDYHSAIALGKRARERAISRHDAAYLTDKLIGIYEKIRSDSEEKHSEGTLKNK